MKLLSAGRTHSTKKPAKFAITLPEPHPGQLEVLECDAHRVVVTCGRRWGKTDVASQKVLRAALEEGGTYGWFAPIYPQAMIGWRLMRGMAAQIPGVEIRESEREIRLPTGGRVIVRSAHEPDNLRGLGLHGVVLEEAAYMKPDVWREIVSPMLATTQGWAMFISTPAGRNWFSELFDRVVDDKGKTKAGWRRFQKPTSDNPLITDEWLEEQRQELPAMVFAQEHLAQFVDKIGVLFRPEWFRYFNVEEADGERWLHLFVEEGMKRVKYSDLRIWAGVDVALSLKQTADYTAVVVMGETPHGDVVVLDVYRVRLEQPELVDLLTTVQARWRPSHICIESASMGLGVIQDAQRRPGLSIIPVPAKGDKLQRATPLAMGMRAGKVFMDSQAPWLRVFESEMLNFPEDTHDDQVDAASYAYSDKYSSKVGANIRVMD